MIQRNVFARPRFSVLVLGILAATGVLLVALGVYGVLAYTVSQQRREIAIRMALGGQRGDVIQMVLRLGLQLVGAGLVIGAAMLLVLATGAAACWVPARRAVRVEPTAALRQE